MMTHMNNKGVIDKEWGDLRVNMSNKWDVSSDVNNKGVVSRMMTCIRPRMEKSQSCWQRTPDV